MNLKDLSKEKKFEKKLEEGELINLKQALVKE